MVDMHVWHIISALLGASLALSDQLNAEKQFGKTQQKNSFLFEIENFIKIILFWPKFKREF